MNYHCDKCGKDIDETNFYTYKDGNKTELCKKCLTMHIDPYDEETFSWILEKMDFPYVQQEWNNIINKAYAKNPNKPVSGMAVFGRYLSLMKLKQWKKYGWKDTEALKEKYKENDKVKREEQEKNDKILRQQFENGEINESQYRTLMSTMEQQSGYIAGPTVIAADNPFATIPSPMIDIPDPASELTEEDMLYLAMKWGKLYKPNEWVELEKMYTDMTASFDIQDADTINTLIVICKTNLKMNQAIDIGDLDGFQKLSKVYESLRKSAKFTAAQNKEEKGDFIDSVGELVAYCEKEGGAIPKYELKVDLDIVDKVINDLKAYSKSLITEDKALARQIEDYLKKREIADQQREDRRKAKELGLDDVELDDEDYEDYIDELNEQKELDT